MAGVLALLARSISELWHVLVINLALCKEFWAFVNSSTFSERIPTEAQRLMSLPLSTGGARFSG